MTDELVALEYVEIDAARLPAGAPPDEAALKAKYEEDKARFVTSEQRLASHILVRVAADADAEAQKAALAKAAKVAEEARAGKDFAELARAQSDDVGSKAQGGDLGWIERGVTEPAFEDALYKLEPGKVSDPVRTDEGYHVILVREVQGEHVKPFEEVRADLERELVETARNDAYDELSTKFTDALYMDQTVLEPAAKAAGLEIQRTGLFGRQGGSEGLAADPRVVQAAFSDEVLVEGNVSDPIELGPNHIVVVRVDEHQASTAKPLAEVRDQIVARLNAEAAKKRTTEKAEALFARVNAGTSLDDVAKELGGTVVEAKGIGRAGMNHDPQLVADVFELPRPAADKPQRARVEIAGGSHAIVELSAVTDGDPTKADAAARDSVRQLLSQGLAAVEQRAVIDALRAELDIKVAEERL
jgi:peptidyl-prolyl cis-trans isomerase D